MFKSKKFYTILLTVIGILLVVSALSMATYALFSSESYGSNPNAYATGILSITAKSKSETLSLTNALPMTDEDGKNSDPYVFTIKNEGNLDYQFDVKLLSTNSNTFNPEYIKLQIDDGAVQTLSSLSGGIIKKSMTLSAGRSIDISIRIWLSSYTPNTELGKTFESKIVTSGQAVYTNNLASYITNLYMNAGKEVATNGDKEYNYAPSINLMNDRKGGTTYDYDAGDIRYYGADPNNYIYFNCDDYSNQNANSCELWRIIGVFDGKVKIVNLSSQYTASWSNRQSYWDQSSLNFYLNSRYYLSKLKNSSTRNKISSEDWYLGGCDDSDSYYPDYLYNSERTHGIWNGRIALIYLSDYAYSIDFRKCSDPVYDARVDRGNSECYENTWLNTGTVAWSITRRITYESTVKCFGPNGIETYEIQGELPVYETLYLNPDEMIQSGVGTASNPYQLKADSSDVSEVTPLSDFKYVLGSEVSEVTSVQTYIDSIGDYGECTLKSPIFLSEDQILLVRYIGKSTDVVVPDTYTIDGNTYRVVLLSFAMMDYTTTNGNSIDASSGVFWSNTEIRTVVLGQNVDFVYVNLGQDFGNAFYLFQYCSSLIYVSDIPNTVRSMSMTFQYCYNLFGDITINSKDVLNVYNIFDGTYDQINVFVPAGSATYDTFSSSTLPGNVTLKTF